MRFRLSVFLFLCVRARVRVNAAREHTRARTILRHDQLGSYLRGACVRARARVYVCVCVWCVLACVLARIRLHVRACATVCACVMDACVRACARVRVRACARGACVFLR